jgi:Na+-driven multidrug efflux pump
MPRIGGLGLEGIWLSFPIADVLAAIIALVILRGTLKNSGMMKRFYSP